MPTQPTWFQRLPDIVAELRLLESEYLDRRAVEKLFGVRERRARQLMAGLPYLQVGNAVAVSRSALVGRLEDTALSKRFQWELSRRARLSETLDSIRRLAEARRVSLPVAPDVRSRVVRNLPDGIEFRPGELRISFVDATNLAAKLFELSQAMANDWTTFEKVVRLPAEPALVRTSPHDSPLKPVLLSTAEGNHRFGRVEHDVEVEGE